MSRTQIHDTNIKHLHDKCETCCEKSKKVRVAFCIPNMIIGGVETVFVNTINGLLKYPDIEITIITHSKIREPVYVKWLESHPEIPVYVYYPMGNFFEYLGKYTKIFPLKNIRKIVFGLYKRFHRFFMYKSGKLKDIDIFVDYKNFFFFKELKYFDKPKITWLHSALSYFEESGMFARLPQYSKIIGITDDCVTGFKELYPQYADRILRIYNPVNIPLIQQKALSEKPPQGKYFCHVSRLVYGKDIKTLLDAFDMLCETHKDINLYIVGDGDKADEFKSYASTLKSNENVVFTGALKNPYPIMKNAIANILSSECEGLPTVVLESVVLGVPCISSNCKDGPHEILLDGKGGFLYDVGDVKTLAKHMKTVLDDPEYAKSLAVAATDSLIRFSPDNIIEQIKKVLK